MAPLVTLPNNVVAINGSILSTSLFSISNLGNSSVQLYRFRDNGQGGGFFTFSGSIQPAFQWFEVTSSLVQTVFYRGDTKKSVESISVQVWDGFEWSNIATANVATGNSRPVLVVKDGVSDVLQRVIISSQFTYFDADGDPALTYTFRDTDTSANSGYFELFGVRQASGQFFTVNPNQIGGLRYRGGEVPGAMEQIQMTVFDGYSTSLIASFQMRVRTIPVGDFDVFTSEKLDVRRLIGAPDPDDRPAVSYQFVDRRINANGGYFVFNGQRMASGAWFTVLANEVNQVFYVGAPTGNQSEPVGINIFDGVNWTQRELEVRTRPRQDLTVQANHYLNIATGRKANSITDPSTSNNPVLHLSGAIERIRIIDRKTNPNGGHFVFKGNPIPPGQFITLNRDAAGGFELDQLEYRGGTWGLQSEMISVQTFSNGIWGELIDLNVSTLANAYAPVLNLLSINGKLGSVFSLSQLHTVTDQDGDLMRTFGIYDTGSNPNSGYFSVNGVQQPSLTWIVLPYSEIGTVKYHMPTIPGQEDIRMYVSDGTWTSAIRTGRYQAIETPKYEVIQNDISLDQLQSFRVSGLYGQTDAGPPLTRYQVFDENFLTSSDRSSRFYLRTGGQGNAGQMLLPGVVHTLTAEQFSRLDLQGAEADYGRALDGFLVRATNDITGWSEWRRINVNTDPVGSRALISGSRFTAVVDPNGKTVVTFSFIDGGNQTDSGRDTPNRPPLPWYYPAGSDTPEALNPYAWGQPAREAMRQIFAELETFANIDFVEVPYQWNVANAAINIGLWGPFDGDSAGAAAYAYLPVGGDGRSSPVGDVWFNRANFDWQTTDVGPGSGLHFTAMHEFGHAIGLKHPFQGTPHLSIFNNYTYNTVMAYKNGTEEPFPTNPLNPTFPGNPATYMLYDIFEIQRLYGANMSYRTGDDNYSWFRPTPGNPVLQRTIWDAGGNDTLNLTNSLVNERIDLRPGTWSTLHGVPAAIRIAYGTTIEYARGGAGNDLITGNEINNILFGNAGNDRLIGMGGNDWLYGGTGNDSYVWSLGDGHDRIVEESGLDVIEFHDPSNSISSFGDDFVLRRLGNDLRIDVTFDRGAVIGSMTIANFHQIANQVETVRLFQKGTQVGPDLDLTSAWSQLGTFGKRFAPTGSSSSYGAMLAPVV
jgi:serralysin